jgi:glycosyltransferase involved in cell wall biosynthesis
MNKGIEKAKGKWIYFMGSDDTFYENETLQKFNNIEKADVDILYGNIYSTKFNNVYDGEFSLSKLIRKNICHQAMFIRKSIYKKKGKFNIRYKVHADWDFNIKCFFSDKINVKYYNFIVANFANEGFSSNFRDKKFNKIRPYKCLFLGINKLPKKEIYRLIREIIHFKIIIKVISIIKKAFL